MQLYKNNKLTITITILIIFFTGIQHMPNI